MKISELIEGQFDELDDDTKEAIARLVSYFHYRDIRRYEDGSIGTIEISPKQLRNLLAYAYSRGGRDGERFANSLVEDAEKLTYG